MLTFSKVEGLGNDFLLVDRLGSEPQAVEAEVTALQAAAPRLCDRRTGVGGDGILVVAPPRTPGSAGTMIVINHDGSIPEMCGNGLRCVALFLADRAGHGDLPVDTGAGIKRCQVLTRDGDRGSVEVDMGPGTDGGPVSPDAGGGRSFRRVSMGNPHAIYFCRPDEDPEELARTLGPAMEVDPAFPDGTNVELARVEDDGSLTLWVWERGCGITQACGTGACATAVAAVLAGHRPTGRTRVQLPGGSLEIEVPGDPLQGVLMTGPARVVFSGQATLG